MKLRLAFPVDQISGKAGGNFGNVFFNWRGMMVARRLVVPKNPSTVNQDSVRTMLAAAAVRYQSLTPGQREAWKIFAAANPRKFLGQTVQIPEISAYCQVNCIRQLAGQAITDTAPTLKPDFAITGITKAEITGQGLEITFTHNASVLTNKRVLLRATGPLSSGMYVPKKSDFRLAYGPSGGASVIDLEASPQTTQGTGVFDYAHGVYAGVEIVPISPDYVAGVGFGDVLQVSNIP